MDHLIIFTIEGQDFAFELPFIERIVWAVEVSPFPHSPPNVLGIINLQGHIIPVINLRKIFGISERELELEDQFIICKTQSHKVALWVDHVKGIFSNIQEETQTQDSSINQKAIKYIIKHENKMIMVFDLTKLLSTEDINLKLFMAPHD